MIVGGVRLISPEEVLIKAVRLSKSEGPNEWFALISTTKGTVTIVVSTDYVDIKESAIRAHVIGEKGQNVIVDLPNSPISGTSKVWISKKLVLSHK
jgi:hypothetical protein